MKRFALTPPRVQFGARDALLREERRSPLGDGFVFHRSWHGAWTSVRTPGAVEAGRQPLFRTWMIPLITAVVQRDQREGQGRFRFPVVPRP